MKNLFKLITLLVSLPSFAADKPNIVLIFVDDISAREFPVYGSTVWTEPHGKNTMDTEYRAKTPVMDRLAQEGAYLKTAWAATVWIQHAIGEEPGIWKCEHVTAGVKNTNNRHALEIERTGRYLISCRRWPKECSGPILGIPEANPKGQFTYETIHPEKARIQIANQVIEKPVLKDDHAVEFEVRLDRGKTFLATDFLEGDETYGVYYTYVTFLESDL